MMTINRSCLLPVEHLVPGIVPDHGVSPVREDHPDLLALVDFHPYDVETRLIYCSGLECLDEAFPGFLFGRLHLAEVHDFPVRLDRGELAVILLVLREMFRAQAVGLFVERVREWCIAHHAMGGHLLGRLRYGKVDKCIGEKIHECIARVYLAFPAGPVISGPAEGGWG